MRILQPQTVELIAFTRAVELGSISAAARSLHVTVQCASTRIRNLEAKLTVRLLERLPHAVRPTPAGSQFYDHAQDILRRLDHALAVVGALRTAPAVSAQQRPAG